MTQPQLIKKILNYMWQDEYRHYQETEPADRKGHIYETLRELKKSLKDNTVEIIVERGIAEVMSKPLHIKVIIKDRDSEEQDEEITTVY